MAEPTSRSFPTASPPTPTARTSAVMARLTCRAVSTGQDRDAHDDDPATVHVVGLADGVICGTVRLYPLAGTPGRWKGDRLAVLDGHRHQGLGAPLVRFAVATAGRRGG